jgi:transposase
MEGRAERELARELRCAAAARSVLADHGVSYDPAVMVLFDMALKGCGYREAVDDWAAHKEAWSASRWHSEICYQLLKAGIEERTANWFAERREEVVRLADGISA